MPSLPYIQTAEVSTLGGTLVVETPCTIWPAGGRNDSSGRYYDHVAEAPYEMREELAAENLTFVADGVTYKLVSCVAHQFLPHLALFLRRVNPGGGS